MTAHCHFKIFSLFWKNYFLFTFGGLGEIVKILYFKQVKIISRNIFLGSYQSVFFKVSVFEFENDRSGRGYMYIGFTIMSIYS